MAFHSTLHVLLSIGYQFTPTVHKQEHKFEEISVKVNGGCVSKVYFCSLPSYNWKWLHHHLLSLVLIIDG